MRDIQASAEARALIGAEKLRELPEDACGRYECWQRGRMTGPTSVSVLGYRVFRGFRLTHAGCADPHILEVDAAGMRAVAGEPARRNTAGAPGGPAGRQA